MKKYRYVWRGILLSFMLFTAISVASIMQAPDCAKAASPKLSKSKVSIKEGKTTTLKMKNASKKVSWKSSNSRIVKVTGTSGAQKSKATIKGIAKGTATITAKSATKSAKAKVTVKHVHKWRNYATCTESDKCTSCGAKRGLALGHSFGQATCLRAAACQRCGLTTGGRGAHVWDANEICTVCNTLNMPRLMHMEISNPAQQATDRVFVYINNVGRQEYMLPYTSQSKPFPASLTTNGKKYNVYLLGVNGWQFTEGSNFLEDELCFAIESFNEEDFFTVTFNASITFDISYFNQRTSVFDKYKATVTTSGCTFTKY